MAKIIIEIREGEKLEVGCSIEQSENEFENKIAAAVAMKISVPVTLATKSVLDSIVKNKQGNNNVH